jgi:Zn-dependent protease with chaperone function
LLLYIPVIALYLRRRWRSLPYTADRRAADIVGKKVLLAAFAKYGETISSTGYPRKRLHFWPTVSQRIERLQRTSRTTSLK